MVVMHRGEITYYIRREVVTVRYRRQFIAYPSYNLKNKRRFIRFSKALRRSKTSQYSTVPDLFRLAGRYGLIGVRGYDPKVAA